LDGKNGLNWYDYSTRYLSLDFPGFGTVDPLAEKLYNISPYAYCGNNPIKRIDPTGMFYDDYFNQQGKYLGTDNDLNSDKVRVMDNTTWEANRSGDGTTIYRQKIHILQRFY
jgi:RHS repeat-associated protein